MNHLYDDGKAIHSSEGAQMVANDPGTYLVWTKCEIDVPANKSFRSMEQPTCSHCVQTGLDHG